MKTKINKSLVITMGVFFIGLSALWAQPGRGNGYGPGQGPGQRIGLCKAMLDLSEEQETEIAALRTGHLSKMTTLRNQMREKRARLQTLTTGDNVNQNEVDQVIDEIGNIFTEIMKERNTHKQEVRRLLTEEQQAVFDARMNRPMGARMGHRRFGGEFGPGHGRCWKFN